MNRAMITPEAVRTIKSYSSANGQTYQYYFYELSRVLAGEMNSELTLGLPESLGLNRNAAGDV